MNKVIKLLSILLLSSSIFASDTTEDFTIKNNKELKLNDSDNSDAVSLKAPNSVAGYTLTLPSATGANGEVFVTDGSGNLSWTQAAVVKIIDTLTSSVSTKALSAKMGKELQDNKLDKSYVKYGIDTSPYPDTAVLSEAKTQAKAVLEKKRIDYLEDTYSTEQRNMDQIKLTNLILKKAMDGGTLTSAETTSYGKIKCRIKWYDKVVTEAETIRTTIDAQTTVANALDQSDDPYSSLFSETESCLSVSSIAAQGALVNDSNGAIGTDRMSEAGGSALSGGTFKITGEFDTGTAPVVTVDGNSVTVDSNNATEVVISAIPTLTTGSKPVVVTQDGNTASTTITVYSCTTCRLFDSCPF
jgi:hypothetical protein